MRKLAALSLASASLVSAGLLSADTIVVPGSSPSWQNWNTSQLATPNGTPFWNNTSWDDTANGPNLSIGTCLTGSACGLKNAPGALPYLGTASGAAVQNFFFNSSGSPVTASLLAVITGDASINSLRWYNVENPSQGGLIFSAGLSAGATTTFTPSPEYGLEFVDSDPNVNTTYLSQSTSALSSDNGRQHFALFEGMPGTFYVGAEDLPFPNSDFDYNDMVVRLATSDAPEPGAALLLTLGITALGGLHLRRRAVQ